MRREQLQLTMKRAKSIAGLPKPTENQSLSTLLKINRQYQLLLDKLSGICYLQAGLSHQAYLHETLHNVKQLQLCMKQQIKNYGPFSSANLQQFLCRKELGNSSNLIGKYESLVDEIDIYTSRIEQLQQQSSYSSQGEKLREEEKNLEEQLQQLNNRKIQLRNKREMIAYQIEKGQSELKVVRVKNCEQEVKLRRIQNKKARR